MLIVRVVTRPNDNDIRIQLFTQLVDHVTDAAKADMLFNTGRIDAEVTDHRLQTGFRFVLQMLFKTTDIGCKAVQA